MTTMGLLQRRGKRAAEAPAEFVRYAEALTTLGIEESDLRKLLAQGRLRGFRDDESLKFLRADIDALARRPPGRA